MVANKARINARGIVGVPSKYIDISFEKSDQFLFFLRRQLRADLKKLLRVVVDSDLI